MDSESGGLSVGGIDGGSAGGSVAQAYLPVGLVQQVLHDWDPKSCAGRHLAMRLPVARYCQDHPRGPRSFLTLHEFLVPVWAGNRIV